jgi:hypothetical protein
MNGIKHLYLTAKTDDGLSDAVHTNFTSGNKTTLLGSLTQDSASGLFPESVSPKIFWLHCKQFSIYVFPKQI